MIKSLLTALSCLAVVNAAAFDRRQTQTLNFDYNGQKVRGVNLGGWLVLEPWITPSLFTSGGPVDEYNLCASLGPSECYARLSNHWNTWITQDDFNEIAADGLNHVRIPIGYWAINPQPGDPYVQGQLDVLDRAIGWARQAGLKIMLDLHGAPNSQNGFDNSGRRGPVNWQNQNDVQQTVVTLNKLSQHCVNALDVVTAIEVLNEPLGPVLNMDAIKQFYYDGFGNIRNYQSQTAVVIHDAFMDPVDYWNGFMNSQSSANNVILDHHDYQIFSPGEVSRTPQQHIQTACSIGSKLAQSDKWLVVGEWTGAQTDCARWLNGLDTGARYDGTFQGGQAYGSCQAKSQGSVADMLPADKTNLRMYVEAQMDAFERRSGWIFWTWKTESAPEWNFRDLVRNGLIPQPITSRQYPNQCGY